MCNCRLFVAGLTGAAVAATAIFTMGFSPAQSGKTPPGDAIPPVPTIPAPKDGGKPAEMLPPEMAAAMEFMVPGPEHAWLAERVGDWTFTGAMWMGPGVTIDVRGTSTYTMVLGGRYLQETMKMTMGDQPYEGMGTTGYSRGTKQFQITWLDSASTTMVTGTGTRSADGKSMEATYQMFDPMVRKMIKTRSVEKWLDANRYTFTMFGPGPDGKEAQMFEFMYTRKAG